MKRTVKKTIAAFLICAILCVTLCFTVSASDGTGTEEANVFAQGFETVKSHASELLSALAFLGSLVIAFAYKKGMLPTLKSGIGTIGGIVNDIKSTSEKLSEAQSAAAEEVKARIERLEELIKGIEAALEKSERSIESLDAGATEREKLSAVISEQVSLLYDVFMFSSMPEYQKDAVGHRVEKMRKLIEGGEVTADEQKDKH